MDSLEGLMLILVDDDEHNDDDDDDDDDDGDIHMDTEDSEEDTPEESNSSTESSTISVVVATTTLPPLSNEEIVNLCEQFDSDLGPLMIGPVLPSGYSVPGVATTTRFITCPAPVKSAPPVDPDVIEERVHLSNMDILKRRADEYAQKRLKLQQKDALNKTDELSAKRKDVSNLLHVVRAQTEERSKLLDVYDDMREASLSAVGHLASLRKAQETLCERKAVLRQLELNERRNQRKSEK